MEPVDYIISGDYILTVNQSNELIRNGAIAIKDGIIIAIGSTDAIFHKYSAKEVIYGQGRAVMPGFVNTHTHAAMVYFRGLSDDLPLKDWLEKHIWPAENRWLSPEFIYDALGLACLEMLSAGITTYHDMYFFGDAAAQKTKELGMRAVLGVGILDFPSVSAKTTDEYLENAIRFIKNWQGDELITPSIAPHAIYTCSPETLKKSKLISEKYGTPIHTHLSETEWEVKNSLLKYGKKPVKLLDSLGFLDETLTLAHCIWIDDDEIELLAENKVGVSHCMESNLKLASGFAPIVTMLNAGIKVTFGTDSAASNNDLNIMSEMATTAKVHKALANDPTVLDAKTAIMMATRWGAEVLGLGEKIGSIEVGKIADIITINLKKPHLLPLYDVYSHIVYAARASDVEDVMVNGRLLIKNGKHTSADEQEILQKAEQWGKKIADHNSQV